MATAEDLYGPSEGLNPTTSVAGADLFSHSTPVTAEELYAPDPNAPGAFKRGLKAGGADLKAIGGGVLQYAGRGFGAKALEDYGVGVQERAAAESAPYRMQVEDVGRAFDRGVGAGLGATADLVSYTAGNQLPMLATTVLGGVGGRVAASALKATTAAKGVSAADRIAAVAKVRAGAATAQEAAVANAVRAGDIGTGLGVGATSVGMELGQIAPEGLKEGADSSMAQIAAGALAAGALDSVVPLYLAKKMGLIGAAERVLAPRASGAGAIARGVGATALKTGALEAGQELAQTGIERSAAGQPLGGAEANSDYLNSAVMGGIMGLLTGGVAGGVNTMQRPVVGATPTLTSPPVVMPEPAAPVAELAAAVEPTGELAPVPGQLEAELADLQTSEGRDVEFRRAQMQLAQQKQAELDAIAAARTEELGRTPDQQIAAAQIATDETPTAMAEAFARAQAKRVAPLEPAKVQAMGAQEAADLVKTRPAAEIADVLPNISLDHAADILTRLDEPVRNEVLAKVAEAEAVAAVPTPTEAAASAHIAAGGDPAKAPVVAERSYPRATAEAYAQRMTAQGFPSEAVPHPTEAGKYAIMPAKEKGTAKPDVGLTELLAHVDSTIAAKGISDAKKAEYTDHVKTAIESITAAARSTPETYRATFVKDEVKKQIGMRLPADVKNDIADHIESASKEQFSKGAVSKFDFSIPTDSNKIVETKIGATTIVLDKNPRHGVHISSVRTPQAKRGAGSARAAMEQLVRQADRDGVPLTLDASPLDGKTNLGKLIKFYESLGFETTGKRINPAGDPEMTRAPKQFSMGAAAYEAIMAKQRAFEGFTAAVRDPQTGEIYTGPSHRQAISFAPNDPALRARLARAVDQDASMKNVGFIDPSGEFVTRDRAEKMMYSNAAMDQETFDSLPDPAKLAAVDAFSAVMREKGQALTARLNELVGVRPGLTTEVFSAEPGGHIGSYRRVDMHKSIITMALNAKDGLSIADHEGFHFAEDQLLTSAETQIIANALKPGRPMRTQLMERIQRYDRENQTNLADEVNGSPAEARAYAFEFWRRGELQADGALARVFAKLREFFEKVANAVRGLGFTSMEDIFTALDRGQFAEREVQGAALAEPQLAMASAAGRQTWYKSALTTAVMGLTSKQASPQGWKEQIKGLVAKGQAKQVEVDAIGLNDWLDMQQGRVTKDQVESFVKENGVRVEEVVLGETDAAVAAGRARAKADGNNWDDLSPTNQRRYIRAAGGESIASRPEGTPKFSSYVPPGGKPGTYRELLLTLPDTRRKMPENATWDELQAEQRRVDALEPTTFRSSHFDQINILAHLRVDEVAGANGERLLRVVEAQSDWGQKGRKEGFKGEERTAFQVFVDGNAAGAYETMAEAEAAKTRALKYNSPDKVEIKQVKGRTQDVKGVPPAPFVTDTASWLSLAIKKAISYAAENGMDGVVFATGEQNAALYDLSKQVSRIEYADNGNGRYHIGAFGLDGRIAINETMDASKLEDTVGKEIAKKIVDGAGTEEGAKQSGHKVLSGLDLKVGGEGMRAFYDKIVPQTADKVLKQIGAGVKVGSVSVQNGIDTMDSEIRWSEYADGTQHVEWDKGERDFDTEAEARKFVDGLKNNVQLQFGFLITPQLAERVAGGLPLFSKAGIDSLLKTPEQRALYSRAATAAQAEMKTRAEAGELERAQTEAATIRMIEAADSPKPTFEAAFGVSKEALSGTAGGLKRWWFTNIATPNFVAKASAAYRNVQQTLNTYIRYRKILAEQMLREKLPSWYKATDTDRQAAFKFMLDRTIGGWKKDSVEYLEAEAKLLPAQRVLRDQATGMIEGFLRAQFAKDQIHRKTQLTSEGAYEKWEAARRAQVDDMIATGYVPLRRYGDFSVRVFTTLPDGKRVDGGLMFFETEARAKVAAKLYVDEINKSGANLQVEIGARAKNLRDTGVSIEQFLGTLQRNGVEISQAERERLVLTLTNSESMTRNKMMRREGLPGYSDDSMRVLHEFGVNMSGELAYARFANAIDAAAAGAEVTADVDSVNSEPTIVIGESFGRREDGVPHNMWEREGPMSNFYRNLSDELSNFVLIPDHSGGWSRRLRAGAMAYFIGGSLSGAAVNAMSVPMMTVPTLSLHTNYTNALTHALRAWKDSWRYYNTLRDIDKMKDPSVDIPGISMGLRQAIVAAADHIFDTEIHQMLGMSQGTVYSKSRNVQRAMEAWMAPFRVSEQTNRLTSFIAAYRIASEGGVTQPDGSKRKLSGQELFRFASEMVDATQNNYNESNRPGAARHPVFALMFMFKSFPLFMTEAVTLMYKQNPRVAVNMLLGLTAMTGVQGLPFMGTLEDLIDTISQIIFGSPFNARRAMRNTIKSASEAIVGADLSELVMHGVLNEFLGVSAASRIGMGDFVPGSRLGTADADQGKILAQFAGAPYAMVHDVVTNVGGAARGALSGDWKQAADSLRAGGPIAVRNAIKGADELSRGYASDAKGRKIVDVSTMEAMLQLTGLAPASVAKAYELESINIQTKAFYTKVSQDMQQSLINAIRDGDAEKVQEINDLRNSWNKQYPNMPIMVNAAAVRRGLILGGVPLDRRSQMQWARNIRGNNVFNEQAEE